ncbi:MAG TPA: hypothetical protein VGI54_00480 [Solirubrobacteraceae bacterium]
MRPRDVEDDALSPEERLAHLLAELSPAPAAWVRAAIELPRTRGDVARGPEALRDTGPAGKNPSATSGETARQSAAEIGGRSRRMHMSEDRTQEPSADEAGRRARSEEGAEVEGHRWLGPEEAGEAGEPGRRIRGRADDDEGPEVEGHRWKNR